MRVFLTGATGFIGSFLVPELIGAGHHVVGLSRSDAGAEALTRAGAEVFRGDVNDLDRLRAAAETADGVIHAAFNHDFSNLKRSSEDDRSVIETLGKALAGSDRPLVITSGTGLVRSKTGDPALETDGHVTSDEFPRVASEEAADALIAQGGRVMVMRLPQVHDTRYQGRITQHIQLAQRKGRVAYVGEGKNRVPAVHVSDAARLYRLALENGQAGARYHAVDEEGVALRDIAEAIGARLSLPVESIAPEEAPEYFGWMAHLATIDLAASGALTCRQLNWNPIGPDLLADLRSLDVASVSPAASIRPARTILIVGASRGLGHAMAAEFLKKGWSVIGTVRAGTRTDLHDLAEEHEGRVEIETLDINEQDQIADLRGRLLGRALDMLFVNAGVTTHDEHVRIGDVSTEEFMRVMVTNALSPMRAIEALQDLVPAEGLIGAMSSGQGSIANNETGLREVYRGSKAALNMFMRSFAARQAGSPRAMVVMAPGWVRTDLGGPDARLSIEESVPNLVNVLLSTLGTPGLQYLDYLGRTVPW